MNTRTVPGGSVSPIVRELDALIARADQVDAQCTAIERHCLETWVAAEIARLQRMNPAQVQALTTFADLTPEVAL